MLAAVLWLGNISFQVIDNENHVEVIADEGKIYLLGILLDYFLVEVSYMMLIYDCWSLSLILNKSMYLIL